MPPVCTVCARAEARYTCPRCQVPYCSLACYQVHGGKCTESFFQSQVEGELRGQRASDDERRHLEKIVSAMANLDKPLEDEAEDVDEEEPEERRLETLISLAESGKLSLEDLSEDEARQFFADLKKGDVGHALGAWEPWWQKTGVVNMSSLDDLDDDYCTGDDGVHQSPPEHLCCSADGARQAHPSVALTVVQALYAYSHALRAFNGDWAWDPLQVSAHLLHLGSAVHAHRVYESTSEALREALDAAARLPGGGFGSDLDLLCLDDVAILLRRGVGSCARGLRETGEIIAAARELAAEKKGGRLLRCLKKLEFLESFAWYHEQAMWDLADQVKALREVLESSNKIIHQERSRKEHGIALPQRSAESLPNARKLIQTSCS